MSSTLGSMVSDFLLLADRYERRARLLPGLFAVVPLAVLAFSVVAEEMGVLASLGVMAAVEGLMALFAGHLSRAFGRAREASIFKEGLPTERWLADDSPRSSQQRELWWTQVGALTGLDIRGAEEVERMSVIRDAVARVRGMLRGCPDAGMLAAHNEEYGFARNLLGLTPVWVASASFCSLVSAVHWMRGQGSLLLLGIQLMFLIAALLYAATGEVYLRYTADRYAESFFALVAQLYAEQAPAASGQD